MTKFTQEELEAAYKQMEDERNEDHSRAERMLAWVCKESGINPDHGKVATHRSDWCGWGVVVCPWETQCRFTFVTQTYGPYESYFTDLLEKQSWAKEIDPSRSIQGVRRPSQWEVVTPEGTYQVVFEYFDNHGAGY